MSACDPFRAEILDVALGRQSRDAVRGHLAACAACAAALAAARAASVRIDAIVRERAATEPPAGLAERILARDRDRRRPRDRSGWARIAVAAALAFGIAAGTQRFHGAHRPDAAASIADWHSPTGALLQAHASIVDAPFELSAPPRIGS